VSLVGRWCGIAAIALGALTVATWDRGDDPASAEPQLDGAQLFQVKGCASCHAGPGSTTQFGDSFPSLADAPSWAGERRPGMTAEEYLAESMTTPSAFISPAFAGGVGPTTAMPQLRLTTAEVDALVAHLLAD
jgi:mono/diheme cytochrome c family protein